MRLATRTFLSISLLILATGAGSADDLPASLERGKALLKEGDTLADQKQPTEAVLKYKQAFEQLLPGIRQLKFKHEVKRDVTNREDMKAVLLKEIDEEITPAEFKTSELGMKAIGFIPLGLNWKETMVKVYSEEIAAFYDPKTKTMHLIKEPPVDEAKAPGLLEGLFGGGKKKGFDKEENKTVIAHELTHALSDQNFDLDKMQKLVHDDDDRSLALSSLVEGEATLAMFAAQMDDWDGSKIGATPAAQLDKTIGMFMPFMTMASGQALREAPPILSEGMIFPYMRGMIFCAHLTNDGGWNSINKAYRNPPQSTEQILHPEKYRKQPDPPTSVDLGKLEAGEGWAEVGRNVIGEMQLGILLRSHGGRRIAAGWDGDRYAVFEGRDKKLGLVWLTTWDTEVDAGDFARQYARFQTTKMGEGVSSPEAFPDSIRRPHAGTVYAVERQGKDVVVVEGFATEATERLLDAALKATKSEMAPLKFE